MVTLLYRVMLVSWRSVLAAAVVPMLRFSYKQARAPIWSGSHEHVFLGTALRLGFRVGRRDGQALCGNPSQIS